MDQYPLSSFSEFESIYDRYKSDEDDSKATDPPVVAQDSSNSIAVAYEPVQVSNEDLDSMLDNLSEQETQPIATEECSSENQDNADAVQEEEESAHGSHLGARPKEFPCTTNHEVPDIVMDTGSDNISCNEDEDLPKESPPPYSEVDPLKIPKERPSSLELPSNEDESEHTEDNLEEATQGKTMKDLSC